MTEIQVITTYNRSLISAHRVISVVLLWVEMGVPRENPSVQPDDLKPSYMLMPGIEPGSHQ